MSGRWVDESKARWIAAICSARSSPTPASAKVGRRTTSARSSSAGRRFEATTSSDSADEVGGGGGRELGTEELEGAVDLLAGARGPRRVEGTTP